MMTQSQFAVVVRSILVGIEPYLSIVAEVSPDSTDIHAARIECPHSTKVVTPCTTSSVQTGDLAGQQRERSVWHRDGDSPGSATD